MGDEKKYGAKMIEEARLEAVPNPSPDRDYVIDFSIPEFTCLCPISGFPDFATMRIRYIPGTQIVELKSLKLYINRFRDQSLFHEQAVNRILDDLVAVCAPKWVWVEGDFNVRGNIKTKIRAMHGERPPGVPD
ncbi:MAG: preQ(1) synthase [bacterium]|nr:preQ(1) synthase [bacterium]